MTFTATHHACPLCNSSDAAATRQDGTTYCFSCCQSSGRPSQRMSLPGALLPILPDTVERLAKVSISPDTAKSFGYGYVDHQGVQKHAATYWAPGGGAVAQKLRTADKKFTWVGDPKSAGLFGQQLWSGKRRVIITEGEIDCLAVADAFGNREAVVSIKNGTAGARKDLLGSMEWLLGFEEVVLCFDQDENGQAAAKECADLFAPGTVKVVALPYKDAYAVLDKAEKGRSVLVQAINAARVYRPDGLLFGEELVQEYMKDLPPAIPYPFEGLNNKLLGGIRESELVMVAAGTGVGKSYVTAVMARSFLAGGYKVGYMALEESPATTLRRLVGIGAGRFVTNENRAELLGDMEDLKDRLVVYNHFGSLDEHRLTTLIRYLAASFGCDFIIFDHISIAVSGLEGDDERRTIDRLMTKLRSLTQETGVRMLVVSHLARQSNSPHEEGGRVRLAHLRGSGALGQLSDVVLGLERDQQDPENANKTTLRVLKNRPTGETGVACVLTFDPKTGTITEGLPSEITWEDQEAQF